MSIESSGQITITDLSDGKDGVGIKTTVITYANSTSGTTAPSTGWSSSVPTLVKGQYLWTKTVWTYTDDSSKTGYSVSYISKDGTNGTDGTSGIIVSSVAPDSPQTGQLWQDTSTTPQIVKKWTGSSWVIWELYAQNLKTDSLSAISSSLGDITGGSYTSWLVDMDIVGNTILNGIYLYNGRLRSVSITNPISTDPKIVGGIVNSTISGMEMFGGYTDYYFGEYNLANGTAEDMIKGINSMSFWSRRNDVGGYIGTISGVQLPNKDKFLSISTPRLLVKGNIKASGDVVSARKHNRTVAIGFGLQMNVTRTGSLVIADVYKQIINMTTTGENLLMNELIPVGYRPHQNHSFSVGRNNGASIAAMATYLLGNDGTIRVTSTSGNFVYQGSTTWYTQDVFVD